MTRRAPAAPRTRWSSKCIVSLKERKARREARRAQQCCTGEAEKTSCGHRSDRSGVVRQVHLLVEAQKNGAALRWTWSLGSLGCVPGPRSLCHARKTCRTTRPHASTQTSSQHPRARARLVGSSSKRAKSQPRARDGEVSRASVCSSAWAAERASWCCASAWPSSTAGCAT